MHTYIHTSYILLSSLPSTHTYILTLRSMMVSITEGFVFKLDLNYVNKLTASSNQSAYAVNLTSLLLAEHKSLQSKFLYIHTYILLIIYALYIHTYIHAYINMILSVLVNIVSGWVSLLLSLPSMARPQGVCVLPHSDPNLPNDNLTWNQQ